MIEDFEAVNARATFMYTYVDNTSTISPSGYEPATEPGTHCASDPGHGVFHFTGGPFLGWGGGLGVSMLHVGQGNGGGGVCAARPLPSYCYPPGPDRTSPTRSSTRANGTASPCGLGAEARATLAARAGRQQVHRRRHQLLHVPERSEPTRYCERVRECACINNLQCTFAEPDATNGVPTGGGTYCGPPGVVMGPDISTGNGLTPTNTCSLTRCNEIYAAHPENGQDPQFGGRQCRPFTYRSGVSTNLCYDPIGNPPPPSRPAVRRSLDLPMHLSTDWQLHLVPSRRCFNRLRQAVPRVRPQSVSWCG